MFPSPTNLVTPLCIELRCGGASRGCDRRFRLVLGTTDDADGSSPVLSSTEVFLLRREISFITGESWTCINKKMKQ